MRLKDYVKKFGISLNMILQYFYSHHYWDFFEFTQISYQWDFWVL